MEPPSLEEMVGATIEPMIETTGNQVDMDVFLNPPEPETELRHRTNVQSVSSGKIKLSLTYEKVCKSSPVSQICLRNNYFLNCNFGKKS